MKLTASGGTDGASIVLFWPDNLPDDADDLLANDPMALSERLCHEGKLIEFPCDGDGNYSLAVFVHCDVPSDLAAFCRDEGRIPTLIVRGVGYFGGAEYMFKHDSRFRQKYPAMCEQIAIPEGTYSAHQYRTAVPDALYDSWLTAQAGTRAKRLWELHKAITILAFVGLLAWLVASFFATGILWMSILAVSALLAFAAVAMSRTEWYASVTLAKVDFEKSYPSYVVHLE